MSKFNFEGKCLLKSTDYSKDELNYIIDKAQQLKAEKKNNQSHQLLTNKNIAIIFENHLHVHEQPLALRPTT